MNEFYRLILDDGDDMLLCYAIYTPDEVIYTHLHFSTPLPYDIKYESIGDLDFIDSLIPHFPIDCSVQELGEDGCWYDILYFKSRVVHAVAKLASI